VTSIGNKAFAYCDHLTVIHVENGNVSYSDESGVLFNRDKTKLICYPGGKTSRYYTIPNSVTSIENEAFSGCRSLFAVIIPNSVTSIGSRAFFNCRCLISVTNLSPTPQNISDYSVFGGSTIGVNLRKATLYVPAESVEVYKAADTWKDFGKITHIQR
jgi:hypothetical protein